MRIIADLQVHSPYSRATSENMSFQRLARFAIMKGLSVVGTGDFTHPDWRSEMAQNLEEVADTELYRLRGGSSQVLFMVTGEVNTTFAFGGRPRRVHHCLLAPSIESAVAVSDRLSKFGNLASDGRPTLRMDAPELVDEVTHADARCVVFPAHAWTPWFSLFGSKSGFDLISDCYQDRTERIFALETGMSSDPPMNWRLSQLDRFCLVSNSDAHSPWPWRLGREANVFDLDGASYEGLVGAVRRKDPEHFLYTIETSPAYGKYHWTGHRACRISMSASEARKLGGVCPNCRRKMTRGVDERVEDLADRPAEYVPENPIGYRHLLPLSEVIQIILGESNPGSARVWESYDALVGKFGSEYSVMLDVPEGQLTLASGPLLAEAILKVRRDEVFVEPGYDGVYGKADFSRPFALRVRPSFGLKQYA